MKPGAPSEYRGEFRPIKTNVSGMEICELMPRQAKIADRFAIVRGVQFTELHTANEFYSGYPWQESPEPRRPARRSGPPSLGRQPDARAPERPSRRTSASANRSDWERAYIPSAWSTSPSASAAMAPRSRWPT